MKINNIVITRKEVLDFHEVNNGYCKNKEIFGKHNLLAITTEEELRTNNLPNLERAYSIQKEDHARGLKHDTLYFTEVSNEDIIKELAVLANLNITFKLDGVLEEKHTYNDPWAGQSLRIIIDDGLVKVVILK